MELKIWQYLTAIDPCIMGATITVGKGESNPNQLTKLNY